MNQRITRMNERDCPICDNKRYLICTRDDGRVAVERCDACVAGILDDEQAAKLARKDGISCAATYPCVLKGAR